MIFVHFYIQFIFAKIRLMIRKGGVNMQQFSFNQKYNVGAYERLSREDDRKEESSSIESQKMIIESFAKFNKLNIIKHYSDDGFTGSNFNRPGFEALKKDIEEKKINCVIVKDLSRLGRELYLTGQYIEEYFLSKNVRFITIIYGFFIHSIFFKILRKEIA